MQTFPPFFVLIVAGIILLAPGWAVSAWMPASRQDIMERLAVSIGLSISLIVLAGELAFLAGFHFTAPVVIGAYVAAMLLAITGSLRSKLKLHWSWYSLAGLLVLAGMVAWRFYQSRSLALPPWVDSVHHVLVVRKILETGGLPADLTPYLQVPFFYHFGFHLLAAILALLGRITPAQAVLWLGQVVNALVALSVYRLGMSLWGDRRRAGLAALLTGFVLQMPAYYLSWGRYTLLAGMLMLPLAMAEIIEARRASIMEWNAGVRLALLSAGVILCHYLAAVLLAIFAGVNLAVDFYDIVLKKKMERGWWQPLTAVASGGLLAAPWLWRVWVFGRQLARVEIISPQGQNALQYVNYAASLLGPRRNLVMMGIALLGLLLAFYKLETRKLAWWTTLLIVLALPWGLRFNPFRPDQVAIILFLPACLLAAYLLVSACDAAGRLWQSRAGQTGLIVITLLLVTWGLLETGNTLNPVTVFATETDVRALQWVDQNTPVDARFFINAAKWQTASYRGVDGGYWLEPLVGRLSLVPPAIYGWGTDQLRHQINDRAERASHLKTCDVAFWALVSDANLNYIYLKKGTGSLQPGALTGCQGITAVYQRNDIFIYAIDRSIINDKLKK